MEIKAKDSVYKPIIIALSIIIPIVVVLLMILPGRDSVNKGSLSSLPMFHAFLNGTTALSLLTGYFFIKKGDKNSHRFFMLLAFLLSSIFLVSYVVYHFNYPPTKYLGVGIIRPIYFFTLISHIILAVTIVPLALFAIYFALSNQIAKHKQITKFTFPIWVYVSITGVIVYILMSPYY